MSPRKSPRKAVVMEKASPSVYQPDPYIRGVVESVTQDRHRKTLAVRVTSTSQVSIVHLQDDWIATPVRPGDTVNVIGPFTATPSSSPSIVITAKLHLLILHPDVLLTATALSNAPQCLRKPLLSGLIRSSNEMTPALVWGYLLHEVVQACLQEGRWEAWWIERKIEDIVQTPAGLEYLVKISATAEDAVRELKQRAKGLVSFAEKYISRTPKPTAILTNTRTTRIQGDSLLAITELLDVEEDIWSPTYGLKGKLDATIHASISDPSDARFPPPPFALEPHVSRSSRRQFQSSEPTMTSGPRPFEIKTGRTIGGMEHRAQTMLYTLLASERYGQPVNEGLLYYTQSEEVVRVPVGRNELRGLVMARNEMAGYLVRRSEANGVRGGNEGPGAETMSGDEGFLPPTIDDERMCNRCYVLDACMLYRRAVENVSDTTSPIASTYALKTAHITDSQSLFFKKWERLIALEEQDLIRFKKEIWTMGAREREKKGRCFADMVLDESPNCLPTQNKRKDGIRRFAYRFARKQGPTPGNEDASLLRGHIDRGDAVVISVDRVAGVPERRLLALARGFVLDIALTTVAVSVDHEINVEWILKKFGMEGRHRTEVVFRIDRDELSVGMGRIRDNLAQLFYADGDKKRLELVVELRPPVFVDDNTNVDDSPSPPAYPGVTLNSGQLVAIQKVLSAQDYALILGMPGTGKTTVVVEIIRRVVRRGQTVLLTSYTHSAVDTILGKLLGGEVEERGILRLGNVDRVHPDVQKFTLSSSRKAKTIEELERQLLTVPVVATTCLSIDHALFERRKFDYCIVDEASQITLPTCLGPLRYADKFILVGDHFQLPPLVRSHAARRDGLEISLFRRLSDAHPHAVVDLAYQYRMNEDIMTLSNKLIYGDRLECGNEEIRQQTLALPDGGAFLKKLHEAVDGEGEARSCESEGKCWVKQLLDESCKAVFVNTDDIPALDSRVGDLVQNEVEAELVWQIVAALVGSGVKEEHIGVLSLYRQQVKLLSHLIHKDGEKDEKRAVEILTADRSQGRDKECVIISMVRSNELGQVGDLVKDWRRINVSLTRARSKLIIIGSRKTLQGAAILSAFFELMDSRQWIMGLPKDAHYFHPQLMSTQRPAFSSGPSAGSSDVKTSRPGKRDAKQIEASSGNKAGEEENATGNARLAKKVKVDVPGLVKGRPILRDLVNDAGVVDL